MSKDRVTEAELKARLFARYADAYGFLDAAIRGPREGWFYIVKSEASGPSHAVRGRTTRYTLCGEALPFPCYAYTSRPVTCEPCLEALACLAKEG